ncbi:MAG: hypothetical protein ACO34J_08235, partial [Prochlorothrix sp.]
EIIEAIGRGKPPVVAPVLGHPPIFPNGYAIYEWSRGAETGRARGHRPYRGILLMNGPVVPKQGGHGGTAPTGFWI